MNKDVKYLTPKRSVKEIHGTERRAASAQAVAELMFVKVAQEQQLDETTIAEYPDLFVEWDANWRGKQGDIVQDEGNLYRSIHDVTNEGQNQALCDALHVDAHRQPARRVPRVGAAHRRTRCLRQGRQGFSQRQELGEHR